MKWYIIDTQYFTLRRIFNITQKGNKIIYIRIGTSLKLSQQLQK